jgi:NAD(P)-dependent dehydrogenase (short-subunit alcohol dehydrogenase family)
MPDVEQTTALVTGATDGLGRSVAGELARRGATTLVHGRDRERGERTVAELRSETGNERIHLHLADLAELGQVRALADEVEREHPGLGVLINNAGIGSGLPEGRTRQESRDGYELRFAVNYLAAFRSPSGCCPCCVATPPRGSSSWRRSASTRSTSTIRC